jgi:MFS family permease
MLALVSFGKEPAVCYVIIGAMGFAIGISGVNFAMISDYFPLQVIGTASGLVNAISGIGFILGPLVAGDIATATGSFIPAFQLAAAVALVLAAVSLALRQPTKPSI